MRNSVCVRKIEIDARNANCLREIPIQPRRSVDANNYSRYIFRQKDTTKQQNAVEKHA